MQTNHLTTANSSFNTYRIVTDYDTMMETVRSGEENRSVGSTGMNERSSRSHTIVRITVESKDSSNLTADSATSAVSSPPSSEAKSVQSEEERILFGGAASGKLDGSAVRISTLNLVDLAGSESVRLTGASGERQKEGGKINQSLLTLSRVISSLGKGSSSAHINYRDSKLTRILQPSLSGNARMSVICCATPSELYLEETRSTLQFASRAKLVKTRAVVNEVLDDRALIKKLQKELSDARRLAGGKEVVEMVKVLEEERERGEREMEGLRGTVRKLKDGIIKGGIIQGGGERDKKNKKKRRMTVMPTSKTGNFCLLDDDQEDVQKIPTVKEVQRRRKSMGTALLRPPTDASVNNVSSVSSSAVESNFQKCVNSSNTRQKRTSLSISPSSSRSSSPDNLSSTFSSSSSVPNFVELDLLRQALAAKGTQNRTLKASLAQLREQNSVLETTVDNKEGELCIWRERAEEAEELAAKMEKSEKKRDQKRDEDRDELLAKLSSLQCEIEQTKMKFEETRQRNEETKQASDIRLTTSLQEISSLTQTVEEKAANLISMQSQLADTNQSLDSSKSQLREISTLLANSNEAVDTARSQVVTLEKQLEKKEKELDEAFAMAEDYKNSGVEQANKQISEDLERSQKRCERMEGRLEAEKSEAAKREEDLRRLMGEEQRALVLEAEEKMTELREINASLSKKLSDAEHDATENRARCIDMSATCAAAESQAKSFKREIEEMREVGRETEGKLFAAKEENAELRELARLAEERAEMEAKAARKKRAVSCGEGGLTKEEAETMKSEHKKEITVKNARIKKLEAVRLTKEQCAALKKMKAERVQFQQKYREGEITIADLRRKLVAGGSNNEGDSDEVDALRSKLRKYASHVKVLEQEKAKIASTLSIGGGDSSSSSPSDIGQILGTVQSLKDQLISAKSEATGAKSIVDQLEESKRDLQIKEQRIANMVEEKGELVEKLNQAEERVASLVEGPEGVQKSISIENEYISQAASKQIALLETENLHLIAELKSARRQCVSAKAELDALRAIDIENENNEFEMAMDIGACSPLATLGGGDENINLMRSGGRKTPRKSIGGLPTSTKTPQTEKRRRRVSMGSGLR